MRLTSLSFNKLAMSVIASFTAVVKFDEGDDTALRSKGPMISSAMYGISASVQKQNRFSVSIAVYLLLSLSNTHMCI